MSNDISVKRKTTIRGAFTVLTALPVLCFFTGWELYPFAPYSMYSHPFTLPINKFRFEAIVKNGDFQPLTDIEGFGQDFLISFLRRLDDGESGATEALKERLNRCLETVCRVNVGEKMVDMPSIRKLRGVRESFDHISDLITRIPSHTEVLIELNYD
jgi:hypothetical protein